jgi:hypothetical protein
MNTPNATKKIPIPAVMNRFSIPQSAATSSVADGNCRDTGTGIAGTGIAGAEELQVE